VNWPNFFRGIFYSFLPKVYWRGWRPSSTVDLVRSALVSGLLECAISACLLILGYLHFLTVRTHQLQAASNANEGTQLYFLVLLSFEYTFHPLAMITIFLTAEGALRSWSAFFSDEVMPSLPIRLVVLIQDHLEAKRKRESLGPDIPDLFERVAGEPVDLRVSAQKPKDGWRVSIAVAVEEEFYEIVKVETDASSRPFIYTLSKLPPGAIIRGLCRYDPPALP
jgi:hypothetical protein